MKAPNQTKTLWFLLLVQRVRALGKKRLLQTSIPGALSPLASLSSVLIPRDGAPRTYRDSSQFPPLNWLGETTVQTENKSLCLTDPRAAFSMLNITPGKQVLQASEQENSSHDWGGGVSHKPQQVPVSAPIPFCSGPLRESHPFLLSFSTHLQPRCLRKVPCQNVSQKMEIILESKSPTR